MCREGSKNHPECGSNEVFLLNVISFEEGTSWKKYYDSVRIGVAAYDSNNAIMPDWYPIFISEDEWLQKNG
ncbi:MAG: hypothetical protein WC819_04525 [Parcubacteria group bacterium]|jgi:hypothetical protein